MTDRQVKYSYVLPSKARLVWSSCGCLQHCTIFAIIFVPGDALHVDTIAIRPVNSIYTVMVPQIHDNILM